MFAHDTEMFLVQAAALVNTRSGTVDELAESAGLAAFLRRFPFSGVVRSDTLELAEVRALRERLRPMWRTRERDEAAGLVNDILREANARPYLSKHDAFDWHLHVTEPDAPLAQRIGAEAAMGFLDLIRADALDRLRSCAADDCDDVLVDLSKNRSRRFCESNCGNRRSVAAYRARKRRVSPGVSDQLSEQVVTVNR
jgi:predicted RNA-binding Zn ribbon-like protein